MNNAVSLDGAALASPVHPLREFWRYFSANKGAVAGLLIVLTVLLLATFAPFIAPYAPDLTDTSVFLVPPAWQNGGTWAHPLDLWCAAFAVDWHRCGNPFGHSGHRAGLAGGLLPWNL
jgi:ABC-type dipeptide/oligopeptide/nickel transport system permease subunit